MATTTIAMNSFALRQNAESKYSHFAGTNDELIELVSDCFSQAKPGYRDGVLVVPVPPEKFFSGVVEVGEKTQLKAEFRSRRRGEEPYLQVSALGRDKLPAKAAEVILYRHDVLTEDGDASTDAEWEIVSLNARPTEEHEPQTPVAMARNLLGLAGGTKKANYSAEQFAKAIIYWSKRAMCA
ncbi:DUF3228 family protein [Candidatus Falkowbacteria bacterium]|nr:DUF3228 family protein [Candidatus Falkowbacteria bacterium]